jgi:predicted DNA-binding WGR domain protein
MPHDKIKYLVLDRCDPAANVTRFYVLSIEERLFGASALIGEWDRIGITGRRKIELHENPERAAEALETWLRRKQRRGYRVRNAGQLSFEKLGAPNSVRRGGRLIALAASCHAA